MGALRDYFERNTGRAIYKWLHYFEIYERHFERFRGRDVNLLEIGVFRGGSLQMWKHYFGPKATIYGVDVDPACREMEEERVRIMIGDQADRGFLRQLKAGIPRIDILIDDGGHIMAQQIATFEELYGHVADDGVYLCEDVHSSYWPKYGGGLRRPGTFVEYAKRLIDQLNAWHTLDPEQFEVDDFTLTTYGMHFYGSVLVIEKRPMQAPREGLSGNMSLGSR